MTKVLYLIQCLLHSNKYSINVNCFCSSLLVLASDSALLQLSFAIPIEFRPSKPLNLYDYTVEVRNRFKGLDLIDRVPDELWMEVRDIVQETGIKTIPMEKKCKKAKWLSGEALQIAVKRREVKSKGAKERYKHLNAQFQRIVRRDKKAFLSDQCKEIEENNRMGKTRDLFKNIRGTKGTFHAKMGSIKDRNGMDLTEAEVLLLLLLFY